MHECRAGRARRVEEGNLLRLDVAVELFDALLGAGEIVAVPAAPRLPDVGAKPSHPSFVRPSYTSTPFSRQATQQEQQRNSDFGFNQLVSLLLGVRINVPALFFSHEIIKMPPNASSPSAHPLSTSTLLVRTVKTGVPP